MFTATVPKDFTPSLTMGVGIVDKRLVPRCFLLTQRSLLEVALPPSASTLSLAVLPLQLFEAVPPQLQLSFGLSSSARADFTIPPILCGTISVHRSSRLCL